MNDQVPNSITHLSTSTPKKPHKPKMLDIASVPDTHMVPIRYMDLIKGTKWGFNGNLGLPDLDAVDTYKIILGGSEGVEVEFDRPDFAFNRICEADTNEKTLEYARRIIVGNNIPVLNHPSAVMGTKRDLIYQRLHSYKGIQIPKTVRITPKYCSDVRQFIEKGGIQLPCIFRPAGGGNQKGMMLLECIEDTKELEQFAFDGRDYYMIEFVDYRDMDGLYRKFRVAYVNGILYPRHLFRGPHWIVGIKTSEKTEAAFAEEKDFLENFEARLGNETLANLKGMGAAVGLDYFGMDLSLRPDGSLLLFEANGCMDFFSDSGGRPYKKQYIDAIREGVRQMISQFAGSVHAKAQ